MKPVLVILSAELASEPLETRGAQQGEVVIGVESEEAGRIGPFVVEYALARQWESWGIRPGAMIGHSFATVTSPSTM